MDLGSILLGLALLLLVTFVVLRPILERAGPEEHDEPPADPLHFTREQVLAQLRDLDFDHATGKINEDDYAAQRAQLMAQGVAVLKELDSQAAAPNQAVDAIEAAIARRRAHRPAALTPAASAPPNCGNCGAAVAPGDRFCPKCGQALPLGAPAGEPSKG